MESTKNGISAAATPSSAKILSLPSVAFRSLPGNRGITGPTDSAELRLPVAHANMIHETLAGLGPAGVLAAHGTLIELARAVTTGRFDDVEPLLAPALVQAAKDLTDRHLTDAGPSSAMQARELGVSARTLQRSFATAGESVTACIRHRRPAWALLAPNSPADRPSVSELAAHWQFADSSHFIRTFMKHHGQAPTAYARSAEQAES
ncbi:helix-turn-helix domain-containing protein [Streptomyces sp. NBC_00631]|uniref:helix-turn-helix domain-containing protein n=1 Tax=Streptomyces sp. NBC_00631 TaxID=2975793 RepID=UPI0030E0334E